MLEASPGFYFLHTTATTGQFCTSFLQKILKFLRVSDYCNLTQVHIKFLKNSLLISLASLPARTMQKVP